MDRGWRSRPRGRRPNRQIVFVVGPQVPKERRFKETQWQTNSCGAGRPPRPSRTSRSRGRPCRSRWCTGWRGSRAPPPPSTASWGCSQAHGDADREGRGGDRRRQARRAVPDRRLSDRLRHVHQHERQRGDRARSRASPCTPTTTSTWASPPMTSSPRRCISRRSTSPSNELLPALKQLERSFAKKAKSFENVVKAGRTHLMDAVPVTLGQEFAGYAAQMRLASGARAGGARARRADPARRHRHRHRPEHAPALCREGARAPEEGLRPQADRPAGRPVRGAGQPRRARRAVRARSRWSPSRSPRSPATSR